MTIEIHLLPNGEGVYTQGHLPRLNVIKIRWKLCQFKDAFAWTNFQFVYPDSFWGDKKLEKLLPYLSIPAGQTIEEGQMAKYFGSHIGDHVEGQFKREHGDEIFFCAVVDIVGIVIDPYVLEDAADFGE